jgi:menaquinone-dependent protoporphyrinogen oxidase
MRALVVYASKHGATQGIAERITEKLGDAGLQAETREATAAGSLAEWDAFVIGSAVYAGHWQKAASHFVRRNRAALASKPVWLFSSGPLGTEAAGAEGPGETAIPEPKEIAEFRPLIAPQEHRVFAGVLDPDRLGAAERLIRKMPAGLTLLPEGDFRDWAEIESWAGHIASELRRTSMTPTAR